MTITLLAPDGVPVTAKQERQAQAAQFGGGSGRRLGGRSGFRVDTPANVLTATSTTVTLQPCAAMIDPKANAYQGMYGWATDAPISLPINPASSQYPRKDLVYIQISDHTAGDGTPTTGTPEAPLLYLAGAADGSNVAPALPPRSFEVGTIDVPVLNGGAPVAKLNTARFASAGGLLPIFSAQERDGLDKYDGLAITALWLPGRPTMKWDGSRWTGYLRHVEFYNQQAPVPPSVPFGPSVMALVADRSVDPGFITNTVNDLFTPQESGLYSFSWLQMWNVSGGCFFAINKTAGDVRLGAVRTMVGFEHLFQLGRIWLNAGETVKLIYLQESGQQATIKHTVRITKE